MTLEPDPTRDPRAVPIGMLRRYLRAHGWRQLSLLDRSTAATVADTLGPADVLFRTRPTALQRNFEIFAFKDEGYEPVELILPRQEALSGKEEFLQGIERAVMTLAALENRDSESIISSIRSIGFDKIHARIPDALVFDDTIHLEVAANYTAGIKSLLAATATTEANPTPCFLRVLKDASEYAERCRFGHTFRGSFGFTVESSVTANDNPALPGMLHDTPLERRVMQRLVRGFKSIHRAVSADDLSIITANVTEAFSANACESFADLIESTSYSGLGFSFSFSPEWPPAEDVTVGNGFVFGPQHVDATRAVAKSLRSGSIQRHETVFGRVKWLESEDDPSDLLNPAGSREIAVVWSSQDLGDISVEMRLSASDYLVAMKRMAEASPSWSAARWRGKGVSGFSPIRWA